ncbi:MAG: hypothetical protein WCX65_17100, partial [bacterium]
VKISVTYSRKYPKNANSMNSSYYQNTVYNYQTSVAPRNIIFTAGFLDQDKDNIQDCCETPYGNTADWCKPPKSS